MKKRAAKTTSLILASVLMASCNMAAAGTAYADDAKDASTLTAAATDGDLGQDDSAANTPAGTAVDERDSDSPSSAKRKTETVKISAYVNQIRQRELTYKVAKKSYNKSRVKLKLKNGILTLTMLKAGKTTVTLSGKDNVDHVFKITIKKSKFKPVKMTKLKCYSNYRKYMTKAQFKKAYAKALKIVTPAGDLNKKQKLQYVTGALRDFFDKNMSYTTNKAHYNDPYGYLCLKRASCAGCARTTGLCLNILGIKFEHVNENQWSHQWCRVKVGKSYWIADPYGLYCGKEPGKRKHPYL